MLISGWVVLLLLATAGFAAYSTRGGAEPADAALATTAPVELPVVSARVSAFLLAESVAGPAPATPAELVAPPVDAAAAPTTTSSTTTTAPATTSTTQATTTTDAPAATPSSSTATTSTTVAPTTTAAPATTAAPTTTTAPAPTTTQATTTTLPATGTTEVQETTTTTAAPRSGGGAEQWRGLVSAYFPADLVDDALVVIQCESHGDPSARNPHSGAAGLFQFMPRTWSFASSGAGFAGADVYDAEANVAAAAWLVQYSLDTGHGGGAWGHWNCKP